MILQFKCCLIKPLLSLTGLAPRRIPIGHPVMLRIQDAHCRIPGILNANSFGIVNAHTLLRLVSNLWGLAHSKHWKIQRANRGTLEDSYWLLLWRPFTIGPMSAGQHKQILRRGAKVSLNEKRFYCIKQNVKKITGVKGLIRTIKKPIAVLSQGLN
jgi:hypothetical protein